jgi:SPP1 family predicted phage head-tail adaptor
MSAPQLNRRMALERAVQAADGAGGYATAWAELGSLWAALTPRSGREANVAGASLSRMSWRITLRAAPEGSEARVRPGDRLRMGARVFAVRAVADDAASALYLSCFADEEDAT